MIISAIIVCILVVLFVIPAYNAALDALKGDNSQGMAGE